MIILILPWWYTVQTSSKSRNYPAVWDKLFTIYSYSQMMCFLGLFIQPVCDLAHLVPIIPLLQPSLAATICTAPYGWTHQWRSQDEQLMWAQHEYIQWAHNTHLLEGNWGMLPPWKFFEVYILRSLLMLCLVILSVLHVCLLHVHMKAITHWSLTLAFNIFSTGHQ